jgi:PKHD-type hydroxylase
MIDGNIRKLSVTVSLEDGNAYEGGNLEFDLRNREDSKSVILSAEQARDKGSIIVFPSFVWHRVTPVTKGTRYSLVIWSVGPPFK